MTRDFALYLVAKAEMKPFSKADWMSFGGCNTEDPLIGEIGDYTIIVDGNEIEIFDANTEESNFKFSVQFM